MENASAAQGAGQDEGTPPPADADNQPSLKDPSALASYRLGYHSWMLKCWLTLLWRMPEEGWQTWEAVVSCANGMDRAVLMLKSEIKAPVQEDVRAAIRQVKELGNCLHAAWQISQSYEGRDFGSEPVPGMDFWRVLRSEADRALDGAPFLKRWYEFGAAVGNYRVVLGDWARDQCLDAGLPDITAILQRALHAHDAGPRRIPAVQVLAEMAERRPPPGPGAVLRTVLGGTASGEDDCFTIGQLMRSLDEVVQRQLGAVAQRLVFSGEGDARENQLPEVYTTHTISSGGSGTSRKPSPDVKQEERDEWVYRQCCDPARKLRSILIQLSKKDPEWKRINSVAGIRWVATEYARRHGLEPPPPRRKKR